MLSADETTTLRKMALQKIAAGSQEAMSPVSDMVWRIEAHYDNALDMIDPMKNYISRLQEGLECRCSFEITGSYDKRHLTQIDRQNIFLIFKEAVNTAIKYGQGKNVQVQVK